MNGRSPKKGETAGSARRLPLFRCMSRWTAEVLDLLTSKGKKNYHELTLYPNPLEPG